MPVLFLIKFLRSANRNFLPAFCLAFYLALVFSNFSNNEFEEQFNSSVLSLADYEDFDGDGKFDLDQEDDEEGRNSQVKQFVQEALFFQFEFTFGKLQTIYGSFDHQWSPQSVVSDIFQPPKA